MVARAKRFLTAALGILLLSAGLSSVPAHANSPIVVTSTSATGAGTLAAAIAAANVAAGADEIDFNITGAGVHTITIASSGLPQISDPLTIDGYTQPGSSRNSLAYGSDAVLDIVIDGSAVSSANAITLGNGSGGSIIRGLVVNGVPLNDAIRIASNTATDYRIEGCFLGTDPTGTTADSNGNGIRASSGSGITIGGNDPGQRNVIAGNTGNGIFMQTGGSTIQGNLIGISANGSPLANGGIGVNIDATAAGVRILDNAIHSSATPLGIDLGADGVTPNDRKDPDAGANHLQNFPKLAFATVNADGSTTISGRLNSRPKKLFTIQFFANTSGDDPDGEFPIGQLNVRTNRRGIATFTFTTTDPVVGGQPITATTTNFATGDTSEFSGLVISALG